MGESNFCWNVAILMKVDWQSLEALLVKSLALIDRFPMTTYVSMTCDVCWFLHFLRDLGFSWLAEVRQRLDSFRLWQDASRSTSAREPLLEPLRAHSKGSVGQEHEEDEAAMWEGQVDHECHTWSMFVTRKQLAMHVAYWQIEWLSGTNTLHNELCVYCVYVCP